VAVNLAAELAAPGTGVLLIDADVYGGVVAPMLGLLDESPGLVAAARQAGGGPLEAEALAALCWQVEPNLRVLTGLPRADRWPELRPSALPAVLTAGRQLAEHIVVDVGFCLEADEELSFDTLAPRRNGATLAVLDEADVILAVGGADTVGLHRLVRALLDLRDAQIETPVWIVLNKVRRSVVQGELEGQLSAVLERFAGQPPAALLPLDIAGCDAASRDAQTLQRAAPGSPLRQAIVELAAALIGEPGPNRGRAGGARRRKAKHTPAGSAH
jgi:MinD-like ATPase involved in chromosome partitioning or flagellar assembly